MKLQLRLSDVTQAEAEAATPLPLAARDAALLAWLAIEGPTPRDRIAALLWPASSQTQGRNTLRQRLFQLRRQLGRDVATGTRLLGLAPGVGHDLGESAEILAGLSLPDAPEFEAWLARQREQRRQRELDALHAQAEALEAAGDLRAALSVALALLRMEPLSEAAHRRVMRLHYLLGERAAALLAFDRCEQVLKDEIGTRPSQDTLALLASIEASRVPAPAAARPSLPPSVLRPPRMVGRERELAQAHAAWGAGQGVYVSAEAGMGKSRLLQELVLGEPGAVMAQARPGDAVVPYAAATRLLRGVLARMRPTLPAPQQAPLLRLLPELAVPASHGAANAPLHSAALIQALIEWLQEAMHQGLRALVLDDLHFADEASLELLQAWVSAGALSDLAFAFAARPAETGEAAARLQDVLLEQHRLMPFTLQALTVDQVRDLLDSLGLQIQQAEQLALQLHRHTGGNPLFILETLRQAHGESGLDGGELPAPLGVMRLIERRLARLSPEAVRLARCAAIAGQDFSTALAAHVLEVPGINLADAWAELGTAQVLREGAFAHDLIFEATLAGIPGPVARHLHAQVAAFLANAQAEPARIAQHWEKAQVWDAAGRAYLPAAERAGLAGRRPERASLLADAARCFHHSGDAPARYAALQARADTLAAHDNGHAARLAVAEAEEAAVTDIDRLQARAAQVDLDVMRGASEEALEGARDGLARSRRAGEPTLVFRFSLALASALGRLGQAAEAVALLEPLQPWVEGQANADQQRQYWNALALSLDFSHRFAEAVRAWQRTRALAETLGPDQVAQAIMNQAWTLFKLGRAAQAADEGLQGLRLLRSADADQQGRNVAAQIGVAFFLRHVGEYTQALPLFEQALPHLRGNSMAYWAATCEHGLAIAFEQLGQPARARELLAGEHEGLVSYMQAMRLVYRAKITQLLGGDGLPQVREALALLPQTEHIAYRVASLLASAIVPPDEGEALATGLAAWAGLRERYGLALSGHVRAAACALAQGAAMRALPHAEAASHLLAEHQPENFYIGEAWLTLGRVYAAVQRDADAGHAIEQGQQWVRRVARTQVPASFVESFVHRNPVNRELLAWAPPPG